MPLGEEQTMAYLEIEPSREKTGQFGPLQTPLRWEIKPFTLLIGPQGSGKSLLSQFVYFFRNWHFLLAKHGEATGSPETLVRSIVERLRSGRRAIAGAFLDVTHRLVYQDEDGTPPELAISMNPTNRRIAPVGHLSKILEEWLQDPEASWRVDVERRAVFIPAERTYFSRFINTAPNMLYHNALPVTMIDFTQVLTRAGNDTYQETRREVWPKESKALLAREREALYGEITYVRRGRYANVWQWVPLGREHGFEIEMAASGQMAGWPLFQTLIALFVWGENAPRAIHVEEPEIHLYPPAQKHVMESLIYVANHGHPVFVTTHSLTILRTLNIALQNFVHRAPVSEHDRGFSVIDPQKVAAYYLNRDGKIQDLLGENGFINEEILGEVDDEMATLLYNLWYGSDGEAEAALEGEGIW